MKLTVNGDNYQLDRPQPSVADLVEALGLTGRPVAVELNRELIPKRDHGETSLSEGDTLEVVTLVGGG
ncbi:MAG: sulfur carrier protein ThiS [Phycisphaeraceae bacterium]